VNKLFLFCLILACGLLAFAQTKVSGTLDCGPSDPSYSIPIPERPGVVFALAQSKCTWTKPMIVEGIEAKDFINTAFSEAGPKSMRTITSGVGVYANGDKAFTRGQGTADPQAGTRTGKWTFQSGTGKLKGVRGGGDYSCKLKGADMAAGYTCEVTGEYAIGAAKK
jgi:hypothetical protein